MFKENQRREKGLPVEISSTTRKFIEHSDLTREVEYSHLKKIEKIHKSKSTILEDSKENEHEDSLLQYASMMGHKKRIQGLKKGSLGSLRSSKGSVNQYFKPRLSLRNHNKLIPDTKINNEKLEIKQENRFEKSQAR